MHCGVSCAYVMGCLDVAEFNGALKALALLPISTEKEVTIKDIESVLDPEVSVVIRTGWVGVLTEEQCGVTWRMIHQMLETGTVPELENLDDVTKAAIKFNRVHGFGKIYAKTL
jgi:hypothetical protein